MSKRVLSLIAVMTALSSQAANIFTSTDLISGENPFDHSQVWTASITSTLSDNFNGDYSKQEWRYTVTNLTYVPNALPPSVGTLLGNGITIFSVPVCSFGFAPQPACSGAVLIDESSVGVVHFRITSNQPAGIRFSTNTSGSSKERSHLPGRTRGDCNRYWLVNPLNSASVSPDRSEFRLHRRD